MRSTRVAPAPHVLRNPTLEVLPSPAENTDGQQAILYEIVQSAKLHTIDLTRSVKSELLSASAAARWSTAVRRMRLILIVCHNLVFVVTPVAILVPTCLGRTLALLAVPLGLPSSLAMFFSLRYDMLYVLLGTYDFWFYWIVALTSCVSLGLYLGDARAITALFMTLGTLLCIVVDASISLSRTFVVSSIVSGSLSAVVMIIVQLQLIPDVSEIVISHNGRSVSLPDIIVSGTTTLLFVLARNAYRRREAILHSAANVSSIRCISFRCTVKLQCVPLSGDTTVASHGEGSTQQLQSRSSSVPHLLSNHFTLASIHASDLKLVPIREVFDGRRTLFGYQQSVQPWSYAAQWILAVVAMSTASLTGMIYFYQVIFEQHAPVVLAVASFAGSGLVSLVILVLVQPAMLRRLCLSFDFAFLWFQLTFLHVCICDSFQWDHRGLICLTGYVWINLALVLDALMPVTRRRIGFHKVFAMVIASGFAGAHASYLAKLTFARHWDIHDRVVLDRTWFGHRVSMSVIPLICSRQPILIAWSLRLLWRIYKSEEGELILFRGAVAYDSFRPHKQQRPIQNQ